MTKHHTEDKHEEVKVIAEGIRNELLTVLKKAEWLEEKTKNYIVEKIGSIGFVIGAPDNFLNRDIALDINAITNDDNFLLMQLKAQKYNHYRHYSTLQMEECIFRELSNAILTVYPFCSFKHNLIGKSRDLDKHHTANWNCQ